SEGVNLNMPFALGTYTRTFGFPSSMCSRNVTPGSKRGGRSTSVRAGKSGRALLRTRVRFIARLSDVLDLQVCRHAGAEGPAVARQFHQNLKRAAGRIDDWADLLDPSDMFFTGHIRRSQF